MVDLLLAVGRWVVDHPQVALVYVPMLLWGHTWQRAGRINPKWSWPLLGLVAVGFAYWRWPTFRRVVHAALLAGWVVVARKVGWPGRLVWAAVTYWAVLLRACQLFGWRAIIAGAPLNWSTYLAARRLRADWRAGKLGVEDSHAHGATVTRPRTVVDGVVRSLIRPAPGKSLFDLVDLAARGNVGASVNYHARHLGGSQLYKILVRPTGGPEGEGELISLPNDPLEQKFPTPSVVR